MLREKQTIGNTNGVSVYTLTHSDQTLNEFMTQVPSKEQFKTSLKLQIFAIISVMRKNY